MIKSHKILVIDDDTRLRNLLGKFLEENNFTASLAKDAFEAGEIIKKSDFDLLIVDIMMPGETGIEFTEKLRLNSKIPVIMLTARGDFEDRIKGLEAGADDYLQKPFEPKELLLRINNILKRVSQVESASESSVCNFGEFAFNITESRLKKSDQFIHITDSEAKILSILCNEKGNVISREKLATLCGNIDERSIDVQITRLRRKIETNPKQPHYLQTVRNRGYVLYS